MSTTFRSVARMSDTEIVTEARTLMTDLLERTWPRLVELYSAMRRRRLDTSWMEVGPGKYLPSIAANKIADSAAFAFVGSPSILTAIRGTPLDQQRKWAGGEKVSLPERQSNGRIIEVQKPLLKLTKWELERAFVRDSDGNMRLRDYGEQVALLKRETLTASPGRKGMRQGRLWVDIRESKICVGKQRIEPFDMAHALSQLGWVCTPPARKKSSGAAASTEERRQSI